MLFNWKGRAFEVLMTRVEYTNDISSNRSVLLFQVDNQVEKMTDLMNFQALIFTFSVFLILSGLFLYRFTLILAALPKKIEEEVVYENDPETAFNFLGWKWAEYGFSKCKERKELEAPQYRGSCGHLEESILTIFDEAVLFLTRPQSP
jgi:hypothetical protein